MVRKKKKSLMIKLRDFFVHPILGSTTFLLSMALVVNEVRPLPILKLFDYPVALSEWLFYFAVINLFINFVIWVTRPIWEN